MLYFHTLVNFIYSLFIIISIFHLFSLTTEADGDGELEEKGQLVYIYCCMGIRGLIQMYMYLPQFWDWA